MKKGMLKFLSMAFVLVLFAGCNNAIKLDSDKSSDSKDQSVAYGTLKVVNSDSSRALEISELKFAEVSVSGKTIFDINGLSPKTSNCEGTAVTVIKY